MIQHKDAEVMDQLDEEIHKAVTERLMERMTIQQRLEGISAQEILDSISSDEVLKHLLSRQDVTAKLSADELARLRKLIDGSSNEN